MFISTTNGFIMLITRTHIRRASLHYPQLLSSQSARIRKLRADLRERVLCGPRKDCTESAIQAITRLLRVRVWVIRVGDEVGLADVKLQNYCEGKG
eukprot:1393586-Amorphochlora_amoeboformis.AAC.1